jgi:putative ABC transport system permease protein
MKSLSFILFLAGRNVVKYGKRTMQSFLIVFLGAFCIMLIDSYMKGFAASATDRVLELCGHVDAHAAGYLDSADAMPLDLAIGDVDGLIDRLLIAGDGNISKGTRTIAAPSIRTGCMLSNGDVSRQSIAYAAEPWARAKAGEEPTVNLLLASVKDSLIEGRFFDGDASGAILDEKYAKKLGLSAGDPVILVGNDAEGSFSMLEENVIGIAREGSLPDEAGCVVSLADFAPAFALEGKATAVSFWFVDAATGKLRASKAETAAVRAMIATDGQNGDVKIRPFTEISASYAAMFEFLDVFLAGMMAIFILVAGVGMTNAILLSVQDRVKDIGTLRAIALTSNQAGLMVYAETFLTSLAASLCAFCSGMLVVWIMTKTGFGFTFELSDLGASLPPKIKPKFVPERLAVIAATSAAFPLLAAMLPARSAKRLTIRECLDS